MSPRPDPSLPFPRQRLRFDDDWLFHRGDLPFTQFHHPITQWSYRPAGTKRPKDGPSLLKKWALERNGSWKRALPRQDVFSQKPGFAWFRTSLPPVPGPGRRVHFTSVSDDCRVYLNGKMLLEHERWIDAFDVPLDGAWREKGPNHLLVLVQNSYGAGFIAEAELVTDASRTLGPALPSYKDGDWEKVHLPHDFVVQGKFDPRGDDYNGYLKPGIGWYRKRFFLPPGGEGLDHWLDFDGIFRDSRVWLNGRLLGRHASGYTPCRYDITDLVRHGRENILAVRADARAAEGWWYEGGGLYRHVWLNRAHPLHVAPDGVYVVSKPQGRRAALRIETSLSNSSKEGASLDLRHEVRDPKGKLVWKGSDRGALAPRGALKRVQRAFLTRPRLWDLEKPNLYRLTTRVLRQGRQVDRVETSFGIRSIRFDADQGFFLNGRPVKLQGTCNHQDQAGLGTALPDRLFTYRLEKLKEMGSNAYRCAHHPHAPELLDACDRLGILVVDENRRLGSSPEVLEQVRSMVLRDRNHPSVILWSLCNEEPQQGTPAGRGRAKAMKDVLLRYDRTRPVTAAVNGSFEGGLRDVVDLEGINYNIDQYEKFRKKHPKVPMFGSETGSTLCTRGIYRTEPSKGYVSAYDVNHAMWSLPAEAAWRPIAERPYLAGAFVWTGFDYRGEPTPYRWPCVNSHFGILDTCGFPKDNYWYYKAWWGREPVLHLFPHWNWPGMEGKEIEVWCHGNCDRVELFLNGTLLGTQEVPRYGHIEWRVRYKPGTLLARGWKDGKVVSEKKVETTGKPHSLRLTPYVTALRADREDTTPVKVEVLDKEGRLVPTAGNRVAFEVRGPGRVSGVGNGDPSCHEPDKASRRSAFNGLCQVLVQAGDRPGLIRLTARSQGLQSASTGIRTT